MRKASLIGRLADNAEVKQGPDGRKFCTFRMACDAGYGNNKNTEWIDCTYGRDKIAEHLTKGSMIYAEGEFSHRSYTGKDGQQHQVMTMRVNDLTLLVSHRPTPDTAQSPTPDTAQSPAPASGAVGGDNFPF